MPHVVVVTYSQTGQAERLADAVLAPLRDDGWTVSHIRLEPQRPYPFPWPFWQFLDVFPETVAERPDPIQPPALPEPDVPVDLVLLAYPVWFLSLPPPVTAFLRHPEGQRLLRGRRVATLVGCRNMWLMAHEDMRRHLGVLGARHLDHAALVDPAHPAATFISTPWWMLTGQRGPLLGGLIPRAGIPDHAIAAARRFGDALRVLPTRDPTDDRPCWQGLGAAPVRPGLIAAERTGKRAFRGWSRLLRILGPPGALLRRGGLALYVAVLVAMILTVAPLLALLRSAVAPFRRQAHAAEAARLAAPSGP